MYFDPTLRTMVEDLISGPHGFDTFAEFQTGGFSDVLFRWAGIDPSEELAAGEQPYSIQLLSAFMGRPHEDLNSHQVARLTELWPDFVKQLGVRFLVQAANYSQLEPIVDLRPGLAYLDVDSSTFLQDLQALLNGALSQAAVIEPAYDYLEHFGLLTLDPATGEISGDFNAFVAQFIDDQPSFMTYSSISSGGGGGRITMGGHANGESRHPWTAWYEDQGSLLFYVADAMGIQSDYVMNVTGWRWLQGAMSEHDGTAGNDLIDLGLTYWGLAHTATYDQLIYGYEGDDELRGNAGVDRLVGGTGNDLLKGGADSDMYIYSAPDGLDRIIDASGTADAIFFSSELDSANLRVERMAGTNDLLLHFGTPSQGIILTNQWSSAAAAIEQINFVAENSLDAHDIASIYLQSLATSGADTLVGSWASERMIGLDGNDSLSGADGNDTLEGGAGADYLSGGNGNDVHFGGADADQIYGGAGSDTLSGGTGNDRLEGQLGWDTYVYNLGDGDDVIYDFANYKDYDYQVTDTLIFGAGITADTLTFSRVAADWKDVRITFDGYAGSILLDDQVSDDAGIEAIQFADGTVWTHAQLMARYVFDQQTAGNDTITASNLSDTIEGGSGNDSISAIYGNDTLIGGLGNDWLAGQNGWDTYIYNLGDGDDVIYDFANYKDYDYQVTDTLIFGAGINAADVLFSRAREDANDLRITFKNASGSILIDQQFRSDSGIEQFRFADGTSLSYTAAQALVIPATNGNDTLSGTIGDDQMWGLEGADVLTGMLGADRIWGQDGNDVLTGGEGSDELYGGAGNDVLRGDLTGFDVLTSGASLLSNGSFEQSGPAFIQQTWGRGNSSLPGWTSPNTYFEQLNSGYASVAATDGVYTLELDSSGANSNLNISQTVNDLAAGEVYVLQFDHSNRSTAASGSFEVYWNGVLVATINETGTTMRAKNFELVAVEGPNTLSFKATGTQDGVGAFLDNVRLFATQAAQAGSDILNGGEGDDLLDGGGGADLLTGGGGADTFRFDRGDTGMGSAADRITDFLSGVDRIDLSSMDADPAMAGDQAFTFLGNAAFSGAVGQLRYFSDGVDTWLQGDGDGDGMADFEIALTGTVTPLVTDFVL
ncbi:MAG: M10 family metallopeptidase C-terminal domain-containing protein [Sphingosinicella sp.]|nr:M10 family metallopeptidase C-terminal domain-containing protein [Sphingosinicella sp.]